MSERPLRLFLSSTFRDLETYRKSVFNAAHAFGIYSDDMIFWSADERDALEHSVERVKHCDVMILLLAHRYGYIPKGSKHSVTEQEYRTARQHKIPVLAFLIDEKMPWPPGDIEWERRKELDAFKKKVETEVTRKIVTTPDDLAAQVSQALSQFIERHRKHQTRRRQFSGKTLRVDASIHLKTKPDLICHIGHAEDGLPLLLRVVRSEQGHLAQLVDSLAAELSQPGLLTDRDLLSGLHQSLEQQIRSSWSQKRLFPVRLQDGSTQEMFVTSQTLSKMFQSLFAVLLDAAQNHSVPARKPEARAPTPPPPPKSDTEYATRHTTVIMAVNDDARGETPPLVSVGGMNRFLGIAPDDGRCYSVGIDDGAWVVWRPFLHESLASSMPDGRFAIRAAGQTVHSGPIPTFQQQLFDAAVDLASAASTLPLKTFFILSRQAVVKLILETATALTALHAKGEVHGDLKPRNIMLTPDGPVLIDAFQLSEGQFAPGWTPHWSPPELVLGEPVSSRTDTYPLGCMLAAALAGLLVGEVRKFKTPPLPDGTNEFDVFYNPSIYLNPDHDMVRDSQSQRAWLAFVKSCLRFEQKERPDANEFGERLDALLQKHPLQGEVEIELPGTLVAATLLDGADTVARLIEDSASGQDIHPPKGEN